MKPATIIVLATIAFATSVQAGNTQVLPFANPEIYEILKSELNQRSVWFEDLGNNRIRVNSSEVNLAIEIADEAVETIIPEGRSQSPAKNLLANIITQLKIEKIPFTIKCFENSQWLVWEEQYTQRIESIIEEAASKMDPANFGGLATCA